MCTISASTPITPKYTPTSAAVVTVYVTPRLKIRSTSINRYRTIAQLNVNGNRISETTASFVSDPGVFQSERNGIT